MLSDCTHIKDISSLLDMLVECVGLDQAVSFWRFGGRPVSFNDIYGLHCAASKATNHKLTFDCVMRWLQPSDQLLDFLVAGLSLMRRYSSPRLVVDRMENLIVELLLVENVWCQKQSWSFMHLLCSGMVGFGLRRNLGTTEKEHPSPHSFPSDFAFDTIHFPPTAATQ